MGRIKRGWHLTKQSWAVVQDDRSLLVFPLTSGLVAIITIGVVFGIGIALADARDALWVVLPFAVVGLYVLIAVGIFCGVGLTACAVRALDGEETTVGDGFAAARRRLPVIFAWAAVQLVVGLVIAGLEALLREGAGAVVGSIVGGIANLAWAVATYFVVPIIALEGLGPKQALKRSAGVVRERWGEGVAGAGAIGGIFFLLGFLPAIVLIAIGVAIVKSSEPLAVALIVVGVLVLVVAVLLQATVVSVFKVALYRFATADQVIGGFDRSDLEQAFRQRGRKRR